MKKTAKHLTKHPAKHLANLLVLSLGFGLFFSDGHRLGNFLFALEGSPETQQVLIQSATVSPDGDPGQSSLQEAMGLSSSQEIVSGQYLKRQQFLEDIKDQIQTAQSDYISINRNVHDTTDKLIDVQEERMTLQKQLSLLNRQIEETVSITQNVLIQVQEKENDIAKLESEIRIKSLEIENQKKMLSEYLRVLYEDENTIHDTTAQDKTINIAKMLLSDKSPEEALRELRYFTVLEATGHDIFERLEKLLKAQEVDRIVLENSRNRLEMLYRQLEEQQSTLEMQQAAKTQLLEETKGQETIYQQLLEESQQEQAQVLQDIDLLRDNLKFIQNKIAELGDKFNPDDYQSVFDRSTTNVYEYIKNHKDSAFQPRWPVSPSRGVSAYFHDESYRRAMGMVHQAIDIRALQGTPIRAPADGVVYRVRDNGYGYSYIILAHGGGFMTVFGHVSEIRVKNGEKIIEGQTIGLSGGTPGSLGAGLMTTGAHLHFEVLKGGKHVDPLDYLPLSYLPLDSLPGKYLDRITGDQTRVSRTSYDEGAAASSQELLRRIESSGFSYSESPGLETTGISSP